jgi:hypothetical protein
MGFDYNASEELRFKRAVERLRQFGYDPKSETFLEFLHKQFLPEAKFRVEGSYRTQGEWVPLTSMEESAVSDISEPVTEPEKFMSRNLSQLQLALGPHSFDSRLESLNCISICVNSFGILELSDGGLALIPPKTRIGDYIRLLNHSEYPVVLRKHNSSYQHVGACFILGLMDGEATQMADADKTNMQ